MPPKNVPSIACRNCRITSPVLEEGSMFRRHAMLALLLFTLLPAAAQKPLIPGLGETIEVSIVNVDVFVTDSNGKRVRGLTKDDFEVFENGVKQPISNFAEYTGETTSAQGAAAAAPAAAPAPASRQKRTIVLFLERFFVPPQQNKPLF